MHRSPRPPFCWSSPRSPVSLELPGPRLSILFSLVTCVEGTLDTLQCLFKIKGAIRRYWWLLPGSRDHGFLKWRVEGVKNRPVTPIRKSHWKALDDMRYPHSTADICGGRVEEALAGALGALDVHPNWENSCRRPLVTRFMSSRGPGARTSLEPFRASVWADFLQPKTDLQCCGYCQRPPGAP